jgi:hypothetical protein
MKLNEVPAEVLERVEACRWDRIIEKHEGPWDWRYDLKDDYVEVMNIDGFDVLLPIDKHHHTNVTIDRCSPSSDGTTLTIFLHDRSYDMGMDMFAGRLAVCERVPEQNWFIAIVYHECWVTRLGSSPH